VNNLEASLSADKGRPTRHQGGKPEKHFDGRLNGYGQARPNDTGKLLSILNLT
jgi:hypothetical protein